MANKKDVGKKFSAGCYVCKKYVSGLTFEEQRDVVLKHMEINPRHKNTVGADENGNFETEKFRVVSLDEFLKA